MRALPRLASRRFDRLASACFLSQQPQDRQKLRSADAVSSTQVPLPSKIEVLCTCLFYSLVHIKCQSKPQCLYSPSPQHLLWDQYCLQADHALVLLHACWCVLTQLCHYLFIPIHVCISADHHVRQRALSPSIEPTRQQSDAPARGVLPPVVDPETSPACMNEQQPIDITDPSSCYFLLPHSYTQLKGSPSRS